MKQKIRDEVAGVSEHFIDDFVFILMKRSDIKMSQHERFVSAPGRLQQMHPDNYTFLTRIHSFKMKTLSKDIPNEENAKIDESALRGYQAHLFENLDDGWMVAKTIDTMKLQQSFFSKYVPAERLNRFFNLYFTIIYPNATSEEIESALVCMRDTHTHCNSY